MLWLFVAMALGHILILAAGFGWLAFGMKLGVEKAWLVGIAPFIATALIKNALGAALVPAIGGFSTRAVSGRAAATPLTPLSQRILAVCGGLAQAPPVRDL